MCEISSGNRVYLKLKTVLLELQCTNTLQQLHFQPGYAVEMLPLSLLKLMLLWWCHVNFQAILHVVLLNNKNLRQKRTEKRLLFDLGGDTMACQKASIIKRNLN